MTFFVADRIYIDIQPHFPENRNIKNSIGFGDGACNVIILNRVAARANIISTTSFLHTNKPI